MRINKHYGRLVANQSPVVVVFMELEGEIDSCLYADWNLLNPIFQSELAQAATSEKGQEAYDLGVVLSEVKMEQNMHMLQAMHTHGLLRKTSHANVEMQSSYDTYMNLATIVAAVRELKANPDKAEPIVATVTETVVSQTPVVESVAAEPHALESKVEAMADQMAQMQAMMMQFMASMPKPTVSE